MKRFRWLIIALVCTLISSLLPLAVPATAQAEAGKSRLEELANGADSIVIGTVVELASYWNDDHSGIFTSAVLSVDEKLKGSINQDKITVTSPGGEVDGIWEWVSDMSSFELGEKAVVFLKKLEESRLPKTKFSEAPLSAEQYEVHGGFRGKFAVKGDKVGNLTVAKFKEGVTKALQGQASPDLEVSLPLSTVTFPYSYSGYSWPHPPSPVVNYRINENTADCTGEGAAVQSAAATWNAAGARFSFSYLGTTTRTSYIANGINEILWRNLGSGGTIAVTYIWGFGSIITENDMEFNSYYSWSTAATPPLDRFDVQTIALHEFGHYLCLEDLYNPADSAKVMYGYGSEGESQRTLHSDDIAGIRYIYGAAADPSTVTNASGASNIATTSARLNGELTSTGGENPTVHIYWGPSDGGTSSGNWAHDVNLGVKAAGTFYKDVTGLSPRYCLLLPLLCHQLRGRQLGGQF